MFTGALLSFYVNRQDIIINDTYFPDSSQAPHYQIHIKQLHNSEVVTEMRSIVGLSLILRSQRKVGAEQREIDLLQDRENAGILVVS